MRGQNDTAESGFCGQRLIDEHRIYIYALNCGNFLSDLETICKRFPQLLTRFTNIRACGRVYSDVDYDLYVFARIVFFVDERKNVRFHVALTEEMCIF